MSLQRKEKWPSAANTEKEKARVVSNDFPLEGMRPYLQSLEYLGAEARKEGRVGIADAIGEAVAAIYLAFYRQEFDYSALSEDDFLSGIHFLSNFARVRNPEERREIIQAITDFGLTEL